MADKRNRDRNNDSRNRNNQQVKGDNRQNTSSQGSSEMREGVEDQELRQGSRRNTGTESTGNRRNTDIDQSEE